MKPAKLLARFKWLPGDVHVTRVSAKPVKPAKSTRKRGKSQQQLAQ